MKKVIHLRGSHGAGKTTAVRQFMQEYGFEALTISVRGRDYIYVERKAQICCCGKI